MSLCLLGLYMMIYVKINIFYIFFDPIYSVKWEAYKAKSNNLHQYTSVGIALYLVGPQFIAIFQFCFVIVY